MILDILGTTYGDADLDRVFNSSDLVAIFVAGEYEDGIDGNSMWAEGGWNCDRDFGTDDLVQAFAGGGYSAASRPKQVTQNVQQVTTMEASFGAAIQARHVNTVSEEGLEGTLTQAASPVAAPLSIASVNEVGSEWARDALFEREVIEREIDDWATMDESVCDFADALLVDVEFGFT